MSTLRPITSNHITELTCKGHSEDEGRDHWAMQPAKHLNKVIHLVFTAVVRYKRSVEENKVVFGSLDPADCDFDDVLEHRIFVDRRQTWALQKETHVMPFFGDDMDLWSLRLEWKDGKCVKGKVCLEQA